MDIMHVIKYPLSWPLCLKKALKPTHVSRNFPEEPGMGFYNLVGIVFIDYFMYSSSLISGFPQW